MFETILFTLGLISFVIAYVLFAIKFYENSSEEEKEILTKENNYE